MVEARNEGTVVSEIIIIRTVMKTWMLLRLDFRGYKLGVMNL